MPKKKTEKKVPAKKWTDEEKAHLREQIKKRLPPGAPDTLIDAEVEKHLKR